MAACPYNARVFNWSEPDHDPDFQTGFKDVPVRPRGVMEKCTLCKERCDADPDNEPMCVVCCPSSARVYGNLDAPNSEISKIGQQIFGLGITGMSNGTSWAAMAVPDNDKGVHGMQRLEAYARAAAENAEADATGALVYSDDPAVAGMIAASVEFTRLFIDPPRPAADPWETANDPYNDKKVGYGRATVAMQQLLAAEGLELGGENNRFEDHMGIELLYLSALCEKATAAFAEGDEAVRPVANKAAWQCHPFRAGGDGTLQNVQRQLHGVQRFARLQRSIVDALEEVSFRHQPKRTQVFGGHSPLSAIGSTPKKTLALSLLV